MKRYLHADYFISNQNFLKILIKKARKFERHIEFY